jgi:hypothetical protein
MVLFQFDTDAGCSNGHLNDLLFTHFDMSSWLDTTSSHHRWLNGGDRSRLMIIVITTTAMNTAAAKHATKMTRKPEGECQVYGEDS